MGWRDRVIEWLGGVPLSRHSQEVKRAFESGAWWAGEDEPPPGGGPGGYRWGYRRLGAGLRDVAEVDYHEAIERVWRLYRTNPLARRLILTQRDQVVDTGIRPVARDERVQAVLDEFWDDPVNRMGEFVYMAALQLSIFGTQVYVAFPDLEWKDGGVVGTGRVRLGYVDPAEIEDIELDPDNARIPVAVRQRRETGETRVYRVIHLDERPDSPTRGLLIGAMPDLREDSPTYGKLVDEKGRVYDGSCFLFRVNHVMNGKWGWPDILHLVDWLEQADLFFFDIAERIYWLTTFVWDVLLQGATPEQCKARAKEIATYPPRRASVQVHNEKEVWTPISPSLGQADIERAARVLVWWIAGIGFAVPETWLGWGKGTTFASAKELGVVTRKVLASRQSVIREMVERMCRFQIDQAIIARRLPPDVDKAVDVPMPSLDVRDLGGAAASLRTVAQALALAVSANVMSREAAVQVLAYAVKEFGVELDAEQLRPAQEQSLEQIRKNLQDLEQWDKVPLGEPLPKGEALAGWKVTPEDIERARREFDEVLELMGVERAER